VSLDVALLEILVCPEDKGPLLYFESESCLYNVRTRRRYEVVDGIPVMLVEESRVLDDGEHARLVALAADGGARETAAR
jgi:uncharacterized protein YbaR (Trm112 family)